MNVEMPAVALVEILLVMAKFIVDQQRLLP